MTTRYCRVSLAAALALPLAAPAWSDTTTTAPSADQGGLDEIVVTAQRRSENLERTPVAVSVLGHEALIEQAIETESDLRSAVPGLTVRPSVSSNQLNYSIRGQTVDAFSGSTPSVLPYVNEVQVGGAGGSSAFYDLESVQVLKGPQGTLFGRNATGGAVLFTTAKPTDTLGGYFAIRDGNYGTKEAEGAINIPIVSDTVLARVAGIYQKRDGFQYDLYTDGTVGDVDRYGIRGSLTIKFSDSVKNDLVVDYAHAGGSATSLVLYSVAPQFSNHAPIPANLLFTPFLDTAIGYPGAFAIFSGANPKTPPGGLFQALAQQNARGPFVIDTDNPDAHWSSNKLFSNITTVDVTDKVQFKNVVGYNDLRSLDGDDADGSPYGIDGTPTGQEYGFNTTIKQFSEEPQLIGKAFDGNLAYVAGAYFSNESTTALLESSFVNLEPLSPPSNQHNDTLTRDKSYAGYGQGTYDLSGATGVTGLSVTAGLRYTDEKIAMTQVPGSIYYESTNPLFHQVLSNTFNKLSWQFGVQEQLTPDVLLYAVTRRSFRSGGFNNTAPPVPGFGQDGGGGFDAETATDVELGVKFQGTIGSMPARLNIAGFNEEIQNIQRVSYTIVAGAPAGLTTNVPKTRVSGLEVEDQINPAAWLKFGSSLAYTDAVFTQNEVTVAGIPPVTVGFGPYPDTPRWSGALYSEVRIPVHDFIALSLRGEIYDQSYSYFSSTNSTLTPGSEIRGYSIANFRVGLDDSKAGWTVDVNIKNAFNKVYYVGGLALLNVTTTNGAIPGDPRTVVGELRYKF